MPRFKLSCRQSQALGAPYLAPFDSEGRTQLVENAAFKFRKCLHTPKQAIRLSVPCVSLE